ncbi:MAG: Mov34/MPN/PAD-1 family protein [Phycisphaerales bacterium]|nr:Mov34/MPN/PAD-1 family protein [Phycisphaerales bacterium]
MQRAIQFDSSIRIADRALRSALLHAQAALPRECCGLLLAGTVAHRIVAALPLRNPACGQSSFDADPHDLLRVWRNPRLASRICGMYHSHIHGEVEPSTADRAAAMPDYPLQLIVSPNGAAALYRVHGARWQRVALLHARLIAG